MPNALPLRRFILYLILALALIRGVIYAAIVPPWQAPDEPSHFERTRAAFSTPEWSGAAANPEWYETLRDSLITFDFLSYTLGQVDSTAKLPLGGYIDLYQKVYSDLYGNRASYALMGWPLLLVPTQDVVLQLYLMRLNTVLMAVAVIFLAYRMAETIFPDDPFLFLGVPLLILFNPQHTHLLSAVNNGNLTELLATAALYVAVFGLRRGFSLFNVLLLLGLSLAAMWTKPTAYFLLVTLASLGGLFLWRYRQKWPWLVLALALLAVLAYFLAPTRLLMLAEAAWTQISSGEFYWEERVVSDIFMSFWAMPGWVMVRLNPLWYQILLIFCLGAGIGLVVRLIKRWPVGFRGWQTQGHVLLVLGISIVTAAAVQIGWHVLTGTLFYRQGRSLYPVIVPITIFLMLGWRQFIPSAWQKPALLAFTVLFFLFDSLVLFSYIIPFFYSRY